VIMPPDWAISQSERLSLDQFGSEFRRAWREVASRFLKLECWQAYQEPETKSLHAFLKGDRARVPELLKAEAERDKPIYADVLARDIDYARIRVVRRPLTPYLQWEMLNYDVRAAMGENIVIFDDTGNTEPLPNDSCFDFLLFDRRVALVHDYGTNGLQAGGWLVRSPAVLERLEEIAISLRQQSIPLSEFVRE